MSREIIENILLTGNNAEKVELLSFDNGDDIDVIYKKFFYFTRYFFPEYFTSKSSPKHKELTMHYLNAYLGNENFLIKGFRGCSKTATMKLVMAFVLACDRRSNRRMYNKVLSKDLKNARQVVTDVYNTLVTVRPVFGDMFAKEGDKKREEQMGSFTMKSDIKLTSGSVGQTQRGHVQGAYRPDFIWFDDIEDRESIKSAVITQGIMDKIEEAIDGMSPDGNYVCTANYISEYGSVELLASKGTVNEMVWSIVDDAVYDNKKLVSGTPTWEARFPIEKCIEIQSDAEYWYSEYMCDPSREDDKFFDLDRIDADLQLAIDPIRVTGAVKTYVQTNPHHKYGIGADTSEGIGRDANTYVVWDFSNNELVETYFNNRIAPDIFAHPLAQAGNVYNRCIIAPEINNTGFATVTALKQIYHNIYKRRDTSKMLEKAGDRYGWNTNSGNKHVMFYDFAKDYNEGLIKINSKDLLLEMKSYGNNDHMNESDNKLATRHFDLLMAAVIGWQMKKYSFNIGKREERFIDKTTFRPE